MQTFMVISCALLVFTAGAAGAVSWYFGRYVYSLQELAAIPFVDNADNIAWLQEQPSAEPYSFLVMGDIQAGYRNISSMLKTPPGDCAFTVQTGDLVSHADKGHYALALYELKKGSLQAPFFVVPGNHDVKGNPSLFDDYFRLKQFSFVWSNSLFIFLDNSSGAPYDGLFQYLEDTLKDHQGKVQWTFVFLHRPPIDWEHGDPRPESKNYSRFFAIQKAYKIDWVFSGHLHDYREIELDGTRYISNGLESDQKGRTANESYYTVVTVSPEKVITKKIRLNASSLEALKGNALDCLVAHFYPILERFLRK
jgi:3',5'-cyclic AMP phosphodiesterase CpdA